MISYNRQMFRIVASSFNAIFLIFFMVSQGYAASSVEIDAKVNATLKKFYAQVDAGKQLVNKSKGILVFPSVLKAGFWIGGQYGEGALRVGVGVPTITTLRGHHLVFSLGRRQNLWYCFS